MKRETCEHCGASVAATDYAQHVEWCAEFRAHEAERRAAWQASPEFQQMIERRTARAANTSRAGVNLL